MTKEVLLIKLVFLIVATCSLTIASVSSSLAIVQEGQSMSDKNIWKRTIDGEGTSNPQNNKNQDQFIKPPNPFLVESVRNLEKLKRKGVSYKGVSKIGVLADGNEKEALPKIDVIDGRRSGHVISWVLQHPNEKTTKEKIQPKTKDAKSNVQVTGFAETGLITKKEHLAVDGVTGLLKEGHQLVHTSLTNTKADPTSNNKYPFLHVHPGNQHSRVISAFLDNRKHTYRGKKNLRGMHSDHKKTLNLIDRLGKRPLSPTHSSSSSSSSSSSLEPNKMPRRSP